MQQKITDLKSKARPIYFKAGTGLTVNEESRTISGYGAIFNNRDDAGDVILPGAFAKSISDRGPNSATNRKIIFLYMHDSDVPLGKITKLYEDAKGLYFEAVIDKITKGDEVLTQLNSGTLNQFSIGYMYVWDKGKYDEATDSFLWAELKLFEISVVSFGCNEETEFLGMKSEDIDREKEKLHTKTEKYITSLPLEEGLLVRNLIQKHIAIAALKPSQTLKEEIKQEKSAVFGSIFTL